MKKVLFFLAFILGIQMSFAQTCDENYTWDWDDYETTVAGGGWTPGALTFSDDETDGNPSSVTVDFTVIDTDDILVNAAESDESPADLPVVAPVYQSTDALIISGELNEMTSGEEICIEIEFSEPVLDLNFSLYDIDSNTAGEAGPDRDEFIEITAEYIGAVTPTLTGSSGNTVSGNTVEGDVEVSSSSTDGNVDVSFSDPVNKVTICFSATNIEANPTSGEPGFGIGNLTFCTPEDPLPASCDESYDWDWDDYQTTVGGGWTPGALAFSEEEVDGNPSSVTLDFTVTDADDILVNAAESNESPADLPLVAPVYQSTDALIISSELNEMTNGEEVCTEIEFSEGVLDLNFTLYDVDSNTASETGPDRDEVIEITAEYFGESVTPMLTGSAGNTVSGNTVEGDMEVANSSADGNVDVSFASPVSKVTICFSATNIEANPTTGEPGFGIGNLTFCTSNIVLPVKLTSFEGAMNGDEAHLNWVTASESNNSHFEVEHSVDGLNFSYLGEVSGAGTTSVEQQYSYIHNSPSVGVNYYRLKQVDFDQNFEYSDIIQINNAESNESEFEVIQNTNGQIILKKSQFDFDEPINIYSLNGEAVFQAVFAKDETILTIDVSSLNSGFYIIKSEYSGHTAKAILQ